jgi:hypothetical protein
LAWALQAKVAAEQELLQMKMQQNQFEMNNQQHPQYGYGFDAGGGAYYCGGDGGIVQPMANHQHISGLHSQMTMPGVMCQGLVQPPQQGG